MRNLTLPCVLLVMGAVAVACDSTTSPNSEVLVPQLGLTAMAGCPAGFDLTTHLPGGSEGLDRNGDNFLCVKELGQREIRRV